MQKPSLCIVSLNAYGAMSGGGGAGLVGGIEWQTSLLARWFAKGGYPVSMLTWDVGGPPEELIDGVRVIKVCRQSAGLRGLRFFHPKWTALVRAMRQADADLYYQSGGECATGQAALWCRQNRRGFVFSVASDADCQPALPEMYVHERPFYRMGLKRANAVVAQTLAQQGRLRSVFGRDSVVIPMPCPEPPLAEGAAAAPVGGKRVLWMGRISQVKRPDRLLEVAALCPELHFDLVGPIRDADCAATIRSRAAGVPNVNVLMHGGLPRQRVHDFYRQAALFCCTSEYEGFPNTFLEAWSHGLPIVSTFDPDGVIASKELGIVVSNLQEMQPALRSLLGPADRYQELSKNARRYFMEHHDIDAVMPEWEKLFLQALADTRK